MSKILAGQTHYYLIWGDDKTNDVPEDRWVTKSFFSIPSEDREIVSQLDNVTCNTKKTKDKRDRRHIVGILLGTKPCGTVILFNELYGSESMTQVHGSLVEYVKNLSDDEKPKVINYDDACHLQRFPKNNFYKRK